MKNEKSPDTQADPETVKVKKEPEFLKQYRTCYPASKKFYVTSDDLVFLENQFDAAKSHQTGIKGELKIY